MKKMFSRIFKFSSRKIKCSFTCNYFCDFSSHSSISFIAKKLNVSVHCINDSFIFSRNLSHSSNSSHCLKDQDLNEFNDAYEIVKQSMLYTDDKAAIDAVQWSSRVLEYNVQGGKKNRGVTVLKAYKILSKKHLSTEQKLQACLLGWCVEMADVGLVAINDGLLLEHGIYKILDMHLKTSKSYSNILQEFLEVTRKTVYGQALDMLNVPPNQKPKYEQFSIEKYFAIVEYKTSHYTFCLPVHLAMHLDDFLDVYGDPQVTGKVGTDIIEGKCSWFAAYVFQHAAPNIKQIMIDNYGVNDPDCVSRVLTVYENMDLIGQFHNLEQNLEREIEKLINDTLSSDSLREVFCFLLEKVHKRKK